MEGGQVELLFGQVSNELARRLRPDILLIQ